ncbi:heat shock protein 70Cb [Brevipalpus obovatus]|uniref:heat shock protein 70Cb n=1 Tax=Brevipalpus obovatus TaxID=246614 RepID=UPI003D9FAC00
MPSSAPVQASICGFDVGSENCYIGIAIQGGIEIILNEYSQRSTPTYVSLSDKQRELGVSAKQKQLTNLNNTFHALNRLVGRQYNEVVGSENIPFPVEQSATGELCVKVVINDEEVTFTATQLLAMMFTKLRQVAGQPVDCVINCGNWFTDSQRRALRDAAFIAGLNPLRVLNDMTAVGIYYSFYRVGKDSNAIAAFVDVGDSQTQCAVIYFEKSLMQVLAAEYIPNLGGKHFDELLADHFIKEHNLHLNKRARLRLVAECEKLKKQMSANSNSLPINVECLYDERDFSARMDRTTFEQLASDHFAAIESCFRRTLENASHRFAEIQEEKSKKEGAKDNQPMEFQITAVEVVGGASRIPAIKRIVKEVFQVEASTTLNADEAVGRGCALQCAILSPSFRVARELQIIDYAPYQINCKYWHESESDAKTHTVAPLFARGSPMPLTRQISVHCKSLPVVFELEYINSVNHTASIGQFTVNSREPLVLDGNKLKVKVRLDSDGLVSVTSASILVVDKTKNQDKIADQNIPQEQGQASGDTNEMDTNQSSADNQKQDNSEEAKDKGDNQVKLKAIDLLIQPSWIRGKLPDADLTSQIEQEANLVLNDKRWKELIDARNELEEYVYEWRDKMEGGGYDCFTQPGDKDNFLTNLNQIQQWLYDEEDDGSPKKRSIYAEKLTHLKEQFSNAISFRLKECETRQSFLERLGKSIQMGQKLLETQETVDETKMRNLSDTVKQTHEWFDVCHSTLNAAPTYSDPPITTKDIETKINAMESANRAVMDDIQKRRAEKQREEDKKKQEAENKKKAAEGEKADKAHPEAGNPTNNKSNTEPMDIDH